MLLRLAPPCAWPQSAMRSIASAKHQHETAASPFYRSGFLIFGLGGMSAEAPSSRKFTT
jgi:hypothetical protein